MTLTEFLMPLYNFPPNEHILELSAHGNWILARGVNAIYMIKDHHETRFSVVKLLDLPSPNEV
jgi:hypothetical protein